MKKIIFYSMPAYGHTNPVLNVARELAKRGHTVLFYSLPKFKPYIEDAGLIYKEYPHTTKEEIDGNSTRKVGYLFRLISYGARDMLPKLLKEAEEEKPDCIAHDSIAIWGRLVAEVTKVPGVSLSTTVAYNKRALFAYPLLTLKILQQTFLSLDLLHIYKNYYRISRQYGIAFLKRFSEIAMSREKVNIVFVTRFFQPYSRSFDSSFHFVGPSIYPRIDAYDYLKTLSSKKKLIYISYGTLVNDDISFYKTCIEAFANTPYQVIISLGNRFDPSEFTDVPKNILVKQYVNQLAVLQKASVFITHGGMNGVSESLYYGVPMVLVPDTHEQRYNTLRVKEAGAGIFLKKEDLTKERLLTAVEQVLNDEHFTTNAKKVQKELKKSGGYKEAADLIEESI